MIDLINLDNSFPVEDAHHATNTAGTIRFIDAEDAGRLPAMQRLQGDLVNRYVLIEAKLNELVQAVNRVPGATDGNGQFLTVDGTTPLTGPQAGVTPVLASHLATKGYVDERDDIVAGSISDLSLAVSATDARVAAVHASEWTPYTWVAGQGTAITLQMSPGGVDLDRVVHIALMEKANVGSLLSPSWVYRQAVRGGAFGIDDAIVRASDNDALEVYIPNSAYVPSYGDAGLLAVVERQIKAVVMTARPCHALGSSSSSSSSSGE